MVNQEQVLEILHAVGEKISEESFFSRNLTTSSATAITASIWPAASPRSRRSAR